MTTWNYVWLGLILLFSLVNMLRAAGSDDKDRKVWLASCALWQVSLVVISLLMDVVDKLQDILEMMG